MRPVKRDYVIGPAGLADIPALIALDLAAGQRFAGTGLLSQSQLADHVPPDQFEVSIAAGNVRLARHTKGEVAGFTLVSQRGGTCYLDQISVHPDHGRKGLGRALMEDVMRSARQRRLKSVTLSTFRDVAWNGPFYRRLGFRELSRKKLTPWMLDIEASQAAATLDVSKRCFMHRRVLWI
jgi:ribosomal protein S18 acetylase RimI-like enzyme